MEEIRERAHYTAAETDWIAYQTQLALRPLRPESPRILSQDWTGNVLDWLVLPGTECLEASFSLRTAEQDETITDLRLRFRSGSGAQAAPEEPWLHPPVGRRASYAGVERIIVLSDTAWAADVRLTLANGKKALCRCVLRPYGLAGLWAGFSGGMLVTRPLLCTGNQLLLNYATSAAGSIRAGILEAEHNRPVPGRSVEDCGALYGNALAEKVRFRGNADLSELRGKRIRLIFEMHDCVFCSFQFNNSNQPKVKMEVLYYEQAGCKSACTS